MVLITTEEECNILWVPFTQMLKHTNSIIGAVYCFTWWGMRYAPYLEMPYDQQGTVYVGKSGFAYDKYHVDRKRKGKPGSELLVTPVHRRMKYHKANMTRYNKNERSRRYQSFFEEYGVDGSLEENKYGDALWTCFITPPSVGSKAWISYMETFMIYKYFSNFGTVPLMNLDQLEIDRKPKDSLSRKRLENTNSLDPFYGT